MGLPYEKFANDYIKLSFSSIRAAQIDFQRQCKQFVFNVIAFQLCRPVARRWINLAFLAGALNLPGFEKDPRKYYRVKWTIDGWQGINPLHDLEAAKGRVRSGFSSRAHELAEMGLDVEELEAEIAADNERADRLGLVFDSDPRRTDQAGRDLDKLMAGQRQ